LLSHVLEESGQLGRVRDEPARRAALRELVALLEVDDDPARPPVQALQAALDRAALSTQVDQLIAAEARVPVLTIHQAKGLEFDVVCVVGCSDGDLPRRRSVAEKRLEEERHMFYVALTRARHRLVLTHAAYSDGGKPKRRSRFLDLLNSVVEPAVSD
jgi:DNA helicase-2/ATP-dependent DNA helicase PcrA